jgi:hypothetical protein
MDRNVHVYNICSIHSGILNEKTENLFPGTSRAHCVKESKIPDMRGFQPCSMDVYLNSWRALLS